MTKKMKKKKRGHVDKKRAQKSTKRANPEGEKRSLMEGWSLAA